MRIHHRKEQITIVSNGEPCRLKDTSNATAEERNDAPSTCSYNDGTRPNPDPGSPVPDASGLEQSNIPLRRALSVATWNVRGLTTRCNVPIVGVAEHWWLGQGRFHTDGGETVYYSGRESGRRRSGVGFIINKEMSKAVMGYNPVNDRIITIRMKAHPMNITVVQVYSPTTDATEEEMDNFYGVLQDTLDSISGRDITMMIGDCNAKVGKDGRETCNSGKFDLGDRNERGDRLVEFCTANDLVIGNTMFQHHKRRLWTWRSPGDRVKNQIIS